MLCYDTAGKDLGPISLVGAFVHLSAEGFQLTISLCAFSQHLVACTGCQATAASDNSSAGYLCSSGHTAVEAVLLLPTLEVLLTACCSRTASCRRNRMFDMAFNAAFGVVLAACGRGHVRPAPGVSCQQAPFTSYMQLPYMHYSSQTILLPAFNWSSSLYTPCLFLLTSLMSPDCRTNKSA